MKRYLPFILALTLLLGMATAAQAQPAFQESPTAVAQQRLFLEALQHKALGDATAAIATLEQLLEEAPQQAAVAYELSRLYIASDPDKALQYAEQAARLDDGNYWFRLHYADLLKAQGDYKKASAEYGALIAARPSTVAHYQAQAECLLQLGDWREAIKVYDQLQARQGITETTSRAKYSIYRAQGKNKLAEAELNALIAAFPRDLAYRYQLAAFYEETGDLSAAKAVFQAILAIDPDDAAANVALAADLKASGQHLQYLKAIAPLFADESVDIDLKVRELLPYLTQLDAYKAQPDLVAELLARGEQLATVHPAEAKAQSVYADLLHLTGALEPAAQVYARTVALNPSIYAVWEQYLYVLYDLQRPEELYRASLQALDIFPNQASINFLHGAALALRGEYKAALSLLENALFMASGDAFMQSEIHTAIALAQAGQGAPTAAAEAIAQALQLAPDNANALLAQSRLLYASSQYDEALRFAEKANKNLPNQANIQYTLGTIQLARQAYPEAIAYLAQAVAHAPSHLAGQWLLTYGDALYRSGDAVAAKAQWQAAQATGWSSPDLNQRLATGRIPEE